MFGVKKRGSNFCLKAHWFYPLLWFQSSRIINILRFPIQTYGLNIRKNIIFRFNMLSCGDDNLFSLFSYACVDVCFFPRAIYACIHILLSNIARLQYERKDFSTSLSFGYKEFANRLGHLWDILMLDNVYQ